MKFIFLRSKRNKFSGNWESNNKKQLFFVIFLITILPLTVADVYLPSLPSIAKHFMADDSTVRLSFSFFMLGLGVSQIGYGLLADKYGRRKSILLGVLICFIGSLYSLYSRNIEELIFWRLIQGIGMGGAGALARTIMSDIFNDRELSKISSYMSVSASVALISATTLGGYIQHFFDWTGNFIFILILNTLCGIYIWNFLPETHQVLHVKLDKKKIKFSDYMLLIRSKIFMRYTLSSSFALAGMLCYMSIGPFLMQENLKLTSIEYGLLSFVSSGSIVVGGFLNTRILQKLNINKAIITSIACMALGSLSMFFFAALSICNMIVIILPIMLFLMGSAIMFSSCFVKSFEPFPGIKGLAGGLYGTIQISVSSFITILISFFSAKNQMALSIILLFLTIGSFFLLKSLFFESKDA